MRRMMTVEQTALTLGVSKRTIYRTIKRTGMSWRLEKVRGAYRFSNDDVIALCDRLQPRRLGHLIRTLTPNSHVRE